MTAAASKYTATAPLCVRKEAGKRSGHEGRDHAVDIGGACADGDEREHVQTAVDEGGPPAL